MTIISKLIMYTASYLPLVLYHLFFMLVNLYRNESGVNLNNIDSIKILYLLFFLVFFLIVLIAIKIINNQKTNERLYSPIEDDITIEVGAFMIVYIISIMANELNIYGVIINIIGYILLVWFYVVLINYTYVLFFCL